MPVPEQTPEGAVAFLEWWIAVLNYAELTGETDVLRANSSPECVFCNDRVSTISETYAVGDRFERLGDASLTEIQPSPVDLNSYVVVDALGSSPSSRKLNAAGDVVEVFPEIAPSPLVAGVQWRDGKWWMRGLATT